MKQCGIFTSTEAPEISMSLPLVDMWEEETQSKSDGRFGLTRQQRGPEQKEGRSLGRAAILFPRQHEKALFLLQIMRSVPRQVCTTARPETAKLILLQKGSDNNLDNEFELRRQRQQEGVQEKQGRQERHSHLPPEGMSLFGLPGMFLCAFNLTNLRRGLFVPSRPESTTGSL